MTTVVVDTFTEASDLALNSHTPDTAPGGSSWDATSVTVVSATDDIKFAGANINAVIDAGTSGDCLLSIDVNSGGADNRYTIMIKRDSSSGVSTQDGYGINVRPAGGDCYLYEILNNARTTLDSALTLTIDTSTTYTWELEFDSATNTLTGRQDSVDVVTSTDSTYAAQTYISLEHNTFNTSALRMDNLSVDDALTAPSGRIMGSLAGLGGLAGMGGLAGRGGGLCG